MDIQEKSILGRRNGKCKGPKAGGQQGLSTGSEEDRAGKRDREEVVGLRALKRTWLSLSEMESIGWF